MTAAGAGQPTEPTAGGTGRSGRALGWQIATVVLLIAAGVLAYLFFSQRNTGSSDVLGETAESSARAACTLIAQVPEDGFDMSAENNFPEVDRLAAAEALAYLAKDQDDQYAGLYTAIAEPRQVSVAMFAADTPEFAESLARANDACAEIAD